MPTGYTYKIIEGEVDNFKDFAKICMRAFGATIHMRDDSMDAEYTPRKVNDYYSKSLKEKKRELSVLNMPDDLIMKEETERINKSIQYHKKKIKEDKVNKEKLSKILVDAENWKPPTEEHEDAKKFMIKQLTMTIEEFDGDYHKKVIEELEESLKNINPPGIRDSRKEDIEKDIKYYENQYKEEKKRVKDANDWCKKFLNSLEK